MCQFADARESNFLGIFRAFVRKQVRCTVAILINFLLQAKEETRVQQLVHFVTISSGFSLFLAISSAVLHLHKAFRLLVVNIWFVVGGFRKSRLLINGMIRLFGICALAVVLNGLYCNHTALTDSKLAVDCVVGLRRPTAAFWEKDIEAVRHYFNKRTFLVFFSLGLKLFFLLQVSFSLGLPVERILAPYGNFLMPLNGIFRANIFVMDNLRYQARILTLE